MNDNPYAAPQADPEPTIFSHHGELTSPYGAYRKVGIWRTILLPLFATGIALSLFQIITVLSLNESNRQDDDTYGVEEELDRLMDTSAQINQIQNLVFWTTIIIWCIWKNSSCKNAWLFQSATLASRTTRILPLHENITPGWAVGSYFLPILNLWKPFQAMTFIRAQVSPKISLGPLVGLWWTAWLINNYSSYYFYRNLEQEEYTMAEAISHNHGVITSEVISIVTAILAAAVIQTLTTGQERMAAEHGLNET